MMESGWMVFLWAGAAAGILLVWLVIVAAIVVHVEERHAKRNPPADPTPTDAGSTENEADDRSRHVLVS
jgi:hypothetical protein